MIRSTFTAELHSQFGRIGVVDTPYWAYPPFAANQDGWLCTDDERGDSVSFKPLTFKFTFIEETANRLIYRINSTADAKFNNARLEQNSNGWLGMYGYGLTYELTSGLNPSALLNKAPFFQDQWKIELLDKWDGNLTGAEDVEFYLRDKDGHRVSQVMSVYKDRFETLRHWFLHAGTKDGTILKFHLHAIKVL
ncbi:hypothetical protein HU761_09340 [Pseudomonas sp. SWRI59]|uniref:hypothetical protein n=1 Tax=Pseudomonas TaxID=286 RepID=UPI001647CDA1|nr:MULTISPECIES: hypothetical protein [unclassified Pseudomonas]MBC3501621.1 hypothetical protein [Pseudomonas sp. SWRI59]MBC3507825.1 hypothetical protein [Pseudomonas sp. SWRI68]